MTVLDNLIDAKFLDEDVSGRNCDNCDCYTQPCDDIDKRYSAGDSEDSSFTTKTEVYEMK